MKEQKPPNQAAAGQNQPQPNDDTEDNNGPRPVVMHRPFQPGPAIPTPARPELRMQVDSQARRNKGRLTRDVMSKLGKTLEAYYDDVRKEGVPDRFKDLLEQLERKDKDPG